MKDQNDGQHVALMVLSGVIGLVVAGVIVLAVSTKTRHAVAAARPALATAAVPPDGRIDFAIDSAALPADASDVLVGIADAARMQGDKVVQISGYRDAGGDAMQNARLTGKRVLAVRHALEANGVAPDHLVMDEPIATSPGADPRDARRVELRLR